MKATEAYVSKLIQEHQSDKKRMIRLYENYKGKNLSIDNKEVSATSKTNNKIRSGYRSTIVDQKNGYLFGKPINFSLDKLKYPQENIYSLYDDELKKFLIRNNADDTFSETDKLSSICGYSAWMCYFDYNAKERFTELNPWEVIVKENDRTGERIAIYYYSVTETDEKGNETINYYAEYYDDKEVTYFVSNGSGGYVYNRAEQLNPRLHGYYRTPIILVPNNSELMGDFERVQDDIDKYEFTLSSIQDEIDQFRMAYMIVTGAELTPEILEAIKRTGAFSGLEPEDKVEFITKNINDTFLENHKKTLNDDIYKFSGSIDYNGEGFSGSAESGESRKWKLLPLENKAIIKERKFHKALRDLFEVICSSWVTNKGLNIDYLDIYFTFSRNVPVDVGYLSDVAQKLKGMVSEDTRLSALSGLVDDVEWEKQMMKEDMSGSINLDPYDKEIVAPSIDGVEE